MWYANKLMALTVEAGKKIENAFKKIGITLLPGTGTRDKVSVDFDPSDIFSDIPEVLRLKFSEEVPSRRGSFGKQDSLTSGSEDESTSDSPPQARKRTTSGSSVGKLWLNMVPRESIDEAQSVADQKLMDYMVPPSDPKVSEGQFGLTMVAANHAVSKFQGYQVATLGANGMAGVIGTPQAESMAVQGLAEYSAFLTLLFGHDDFVDKTSSPGFENQALLQDWNSIIGDAFYGDKASYIDFEKLVAPKLNEMLEKHGLLELNPRFKVQIFAVTRGLISFSKNLNASLKNIFGSSCDIVSLRKSFDKTMRQYFNSTQMMAERRHNRHIPSDEEYHQLRKFTSAVEPVLELALLYKGLTLDEDGDYERLWCNFDYVRDCVNMIVCETNDLYSNWKDSDSEEQDDKAKFAMDSKVRIRLFHRKFNEMLAGSRQDAEALFESSFGGLDDAGLEAPLQKLKASLTDDSPDKADAHTRGLQAFSSSVNTWEGQLDVFLSGLIEEVDLEKAFDAKDFVDVPEYFETWAAEGKTIKDVIQEVERLQAKVQEAKASVIAYKEGVFKVVVKAMKEAPPEETAEVAKGVRQDIKEKVTQMMAKIKETFNISSNGEFLIRAQDMKPASEGMQAFLRFMIAWAQCFLWHSVSSRYEAVVEAK